MAFIAAAAAYPAFAAYGLAAPAFGYDAFAFAAPLGFAAPAAAILF